MGRLKSKVELEGALEKKLQLDPSWCETVLMLKSKLQAIGGTTVDSERAFHLMSRILNKLTKRLNKNLGARLKVTMHLPKDPAKIDWKKAY